MKHLIYKWLFGYRYMVIRQKPYGPKREPIGEDDWSYFRELASAIELADRCGEPVFDMSFHRIYERNGKKFEKTA